MTICKIEGCGKPVDSRGWCRMHYSRWKRHGDPTKTAGRPHVKTRAELAEYVLSRLVPNGECLDWPGNRYRCGYGVTGFMAKKKLATHRIVCEHVHGAPPPDKPHAIHSCDRKICCNPAHLRWGSRSDNMQDAVKRGRHRGWTVHVKGERVGGAKLTAEDVRRIRFWCSHGCTQKSVAHGLGVRRITVSDVVNRRTWAHL